MRKLIKIVLISAGIILLSIALVLLLISALSSSGLDDNDSGQQVCTLIGCSESVSFQIPQEVAQSLEFSQILVEFEDGSSIGFDVEGLEGSRINFSEFENPLPVSKDSLLLMQRIRITNLDANEVFGFEVREIQESFFRPNGPNCDPQCSNLMIVLNLDSN
ncbi:MAG: hypothetical protein LAT82_03010 [Nanoarchaeota archaeon]|nr:hypothetical protein [Nanoarchaeota archaeon]